MRSRKASVRYRIAPKTRGVTAHDVFDRTSNSQSTSTLNRRSVVCSQATRGSCCLKCRKGLSFGSGVDEQQGILVSVLGSC